MTNNTENTQHAGSFSSIEDLVAVMDPEIHQNLKTAIELGRWANGDKLSKKQKEDCLQAIIAYEARHLKKEDRIGYIDTSKLKKSHDKPLDSTEPVSLKWSED